MNNDAVSIWREYQRGIEFLNSFNYYHKAEECARFYNGDQWQGLETGGLRMPQLNFIQPIIKYKTATVNSNGNTIYYSCNDTGETYIAGTEVCKKINALALKTWERLNMDYFLWVFTKHAAINGDAYAYFFNDEINGIQMREINPTDIYFADEQDTDIQSQKYIIISQRLLASNVKAQAKANGLDENEISMITPDSDLNQQIGDKAKIEIALDDEDGKLICLTKFFKKDGIVHFVKSTKNVVYHPETRIDNLNLYPFAHQSWENETGSARGIGEVWNIIPNQIEVNKAFARHMLMSKHYIYPHIVYDSAKLTTEQVNNLSTVGSNIALNNVNVQDVRTIIDYMTPPNIPTDSLTVVNQLIQLTRELSGSSDIATGQINPERASGTAILAVRDAAALPLNEQSAHQKQFIEDIARIWLNMWIAYNPNGLVVTNQAIDESGNETVNEEIVDIDALHELNLDVKIDVSPANPFSKYAQEQSLESFLAQNIISFEEYVEALEDDAAAPKSKLQSIIAKRYELQKQQQMNQQALEAEQRAVNQMQQQADSEKTAAAVENLLKENSALKGQINERISENNS